MKLVDVNVWLAASWSRHVHHHVACRWVEAEQDDMAFCRVTELAFLRLATMPAITGDDAVSRRQAWNMLLALQADPRISYLAEPRDYLAAFAQAAGAELVTFDAAIRTRHPSVDVEVLRG